MNTISPARLAVLAATMAVLSVPVFAADNTSSTSVSTTPTYVDITINHIAESTGIEMGDGARARGTGSIATGKNSVAIGKNAVATGGNENRDSILQKINENKEKLNEIETAQNNVNSLTDDIQTIRAKYADVIEAGTRVQQVQQAKENAYQDWQTKLNDYNTAVDGSKQYIAAAQAKIDDLNSRLSATEKLGSVDITSEAGLTAAAVKLKGMVEEGSTLNLSQDFYKDYVKNYYQALGDLRENQLISAKTDSLNFRDPDNEGLNTLVNKFIHLNRFYELSTGIRWSSFDGLESGEYITGICTNFHLDPTSTDLPSQDLVFKNVNTDVSTLQEWQTAEADIPKFKAAFKTYFTNCNDRFMTDNVRTALLNQIDTKLDAWGKAYEVTYYQNQYEATKDTTWLDKKKKALDEYNNLVTKLYELPDAYDIRRNTIAAWKKTNITDIQDKNKVTTDTLTSELEKALGVSKDAITKKQQELADLKEKADQAKTNYDAINPDSKDLYLSEQYDTVMKQLTDKANELKASQDKLDALKAALTLNDLTNTGENAYALGTDALSTGTNAYALGTSAIATGENAIAFGDGAVTTAKDSIAVGTGAAVLGTQSGAFGKGNTVYSDNSYALGNNNTIGTTDSSTKKPVAGKGEHTFVLGSSITTTANNAVILGYGSTDGGDNTVSFGSNTQKRRLVNIADGTLSATSTDAVTGRQLYQTNQNITGFASQIKQNADALKGLSTSVSNALSSVSAMSDGISAIDNTKADASLTNLSDAGRNVINEAATEAVQNYMKNLKSSSAGMQSKAKANTQIRTDAAMSNMVTHYVLSSVAADNAADATPATKADITYVDAGLSLKADKDSVYTKTETDQKLSAKADKTDVDARFTKVNTELASKAAADASNIDTEAYTKKLGTGTVTKTDANLVTGSTVYQALSANNLGMMNYVDQKDAELADSFGRQLSQTASSLTHDINKVGAGAAALAGLHPGDYDPQDKWDFAAGYGHYKGANASAFGIYYHPNEDTMLNLSGTIGNGDPMLSAGVTFKLGSGAGQNTMSRAALTKALSATQAQNQQLASDVEQLKAQIQQLLNQQSANPSSTH